MPLVSVPAIYDGEHVRLLEKVPIQGPYRVVVTFVEPAEEREASLERFWSSFGAWDETRPVEETLRDIYDARRSRTEPPAL